MKLYLIAIFIFNFVSAYSLAATDDTTIASTYAQQQNQMPSSTATQPHSNQEPKLLTQKTGYLGGAFGIAAANHDVGAGMGYGGDLAFFPQSYFGLGALYRGGVHGTPDSTLWAGELMLRPIGTFTLGILFGGAKLNDAKENTGTSFAYGGKVGYDFRLGDAPFSVGPEVDWVFFKPGASTISDLVALASLKLWL